MNEKLTNADMPQGAVLTRREAHRPASDPVAEAREVLAHISKPPWCLHPNGTSVWTGAEYDSAWEDPSCRPVCKAPGHTAEADIEQDVDNMAFIADAPILVIRLCERLERLRARSPSADKLLAAAAELIDDMVVCINEMSDDSCMSDRFCERSQELDARIEEYFSTTEEGP